MLSNVFAAICAQFIHTFLCTSIYTSVKCTRILKKYICRYVYLYAYSHPGVDRIWFLKRVFIFLKNTVIFDPIDRIWIFWGFQPSVHSETASSAIFYLWVWKMTFFIFENPGILSTPGWLYMYTHIYIYLSKYMPIRWAGLPALPQKKMAAQVQILVRENGYLRELLQRQGCEELRSSGLRGWAAGEQQAELQESCSLICFRPKPLNLLILRPPTP